MIISKCFVKAVGTSAAPISCTNALSYWNITLYNIHYTMRYIIIQPLGARVYGDACIPTHCAMYIYLL